MRTNTTELTRDIFADEFSRHNLSDWAGSSTSCPLVVVFSTTADTELARNGRGGAKTWSTGLVTAICFPRTVTDARIMITGYESQWFGRGSINQRLSSVADHLLQSLTYQRSRGSKRPDGFVCHYLGDIIVEVFLYLVHNYDRVIAQIYSCLWYAALTWNAFSKH